MCVIIVVPKASNFPSHDVLQSCWKSNPHGAGFMFNSKYKLEIIKGLMTFKSFMHALETKCNYNSDVVIHFRLASHGQVNKYNTHPWAIDEDTAMVHNGIINSLADDRTKSDSEKMAKVLAGMDLDNKLTVDYIESTLDWNKIVIMNSSGNYKILNEKKGFWINGCWYSNMNWSTSSRRMDTVSIQELIGFSYDA